jgi:hypothetical protein
VLQVGRPQVFQPSEERRSAVVLSILFILVCSAAAVGLLYVIRRYLAPPGGFYHDAEVASGIFGVVGTGYAVLLGFVTFSVFGTYDAARQHVAQEAVALRQMSATAGFFAPEDAQALRGQLVCYGRAVVNGEWAAMQVPRESTRVTGWVNQLDATTQKMLVETSKESVALQSWFEQSKDRQEARRGRLAEAAPFVPVFVWAILLVLLFVVIFYQCLFAEPRRPLFAEAVGVGAMALTLVAALSLVWILDRPFNDRGAMITSTRTQTVVADLEQSYAYPASTIPCDAVGQPAA